MTDDPKATRPTYAVLPVGEPPPPAPAPPPPPRAVDAPIHYQHITTTGTLLDVLA